MGHGVAPMISVETTIPPVLMMLIDILLTMLIAYLLVGAPLTVSMTGPMIGKILDHDLRIIARILGMGLISGKGSVLQAPTMMIGLLAPIIEVIGTGNIAHLLTGEIINPPKTVGNNTGPEGNLCLQIQKTGSDILSMILLPQGGWHLPFLRRGGGTISNHQYRAIDGWT